MTPLYGIAELARAAGVRDKTLSGYLARKQCPEPDYRLACGPIWTEATVRPWLDARDTRLERIVETADTAWGREVAALASVVRVSESPAVWGYRQAKYETACRNSDRSKHEKKHGEGSSRIPTVKQEAHKYAEKQLAQFGGFMDPRTGRIMQKREWAVNRLTARRNVRVGAPDGIPF